MLAEWTSQVEEAEQLSKRQSPYLSDLIGNLMSGIELEKIMTRILGRERQGMKGRNFTEIVWGLLVF